MLCARSTEWQSFRISNISHKYASLPLYWCTLCWLSIIHQPLKKKGGKKKKTVCSASIYAPYQNRNHIPAAAIILVNQHHLMHLAAVFQIQMKHLCKSNRPSALVLIDGGFVKMMQLVITSHQTPRRHNSAWQLDPSFDSLELVEFSLNTCHCNELNIPRRHRRVFLLNKHPRDAKLGLHEELEVLRRGLFGFI